MSVDYLSREVRRHARDSGWPRHLSESLGVEHSGGHLRVSVPDHLADEVMDLEYGTPSTPPSGAMRQFLNRSSRAADDMVHHESLSYLDFLGVL